jgi:hypothetical protein
MSRVQLFSKTFFFRDILKPNLGMAKNVVLSTVAILFFSASQSYADSLAFYGAHIAIPPGWTEQDQPTPNERYFFNNDHSATVNISYYRAEELSSVNALAQHRIISRFEGWIALLDRPAKKEELARVNANDGRIVVYNRQTIQAPGNIKEEIVGEYYYFVSPNIGYVISVESELKSWKEQQPTFRGIIDSFGIGQVPPPIQRSAPATTRVQPAKTTDIFGRQLVGNTNALNINDPIKRHYKINLNLANAGHPHSWILSGNNIYLQFDTYLIAVDTLSKKMGWAFQLPGTPLSPIWDHRGALYMVRSGADGEAFLLAIQPDSGGVIFSENLGKNSVLAIGHGNTLVMIQDGHNIIRDIDTQKTQVTDDIDHIFLLPDTMIFNKDTTLFTEKNTIELSGYPQHIIGDQNRYYSTTHTSENVAIEALSSTKEKAIWRVDLGNYEVLHAPILQNTQLILFVRNTFKNSHYVLRINAETGQLLHQEETPGSIEKGTLFGNGIYLQGQSTSGPYASWLDWESSTIRLLKKTTPQTGSGMTSQNKWWLFIDQETLVLSEINTIK